MAKPLLVILAAGRSARFAQAGWKYHKLSLPMPDNRTLLEWNIDRYEQDNLFLITLKEHTPQVIPVLHRIFLKKPYEFSLQHRFMQRNDGPFLDLNKYRNMLGKKHEVIVAYCDMLPGEGMLPHFIAEARESEYNAAIIGITPLERHNPIPNTSLADGGIFWFRDGREMVKKMGLIKSQKDMEVKDIVFSYEDYLVCHTDNIVDLGVPEDYRMWMGEQGYPVNENWEIENGRRKKK